MNETILDLEEKYLKNIKVEVKPIVRGRSFFPKGHDGEFRYSGCYEEFTLPYSSSKRSYSSIFDSKEEQAFFENILNKKPGALSFYDRNSEFWGKEFKVKISKEGKTLDLSIPMHMLEYKVLLANTHLVAPDWTSRFKNPGYQYAVVDDGQIQEDSYKAAAKNEEAMDIFFKIRKSNKKMYDVLRLLGKKPAKTSIDNTAWLKSEINKVIEQKQSKPGLIGIDDFIRVASDRNLSEKVFVLDAIDLGEIKLDGSTYRVNQTNAIIGRSLEQAIEWFADPRNQEDKLFIEQRLKLNDK